MPTPQTATTGVSHPIAAGQGITSGLCRGPGQRPRSGHDRAVSGGVPPAGPSGQRSLPGLGMGVVVVGGFHPRGEQSVQLQQRSGPPRCPWQQCLRRWSREPRRGTGRSRCARTFYFSASLGSVRGAVDQPDPEFPACPEQPFINESTSVVSLAPTSAQCRLCRPLGYADLVGDRPAGQGFRAGQVGIIQGLRARSSPFGWWDRSRRMRRGSRRCWPSVAIHRCPGSGSCR